MRKKAELCRAAVSAEDVDVAMEDLHHAQTEMMAARRDQIVAAASERPSFRATVVQALLTEGLGAFTSRGWHMSDRELLAAVRVSYRMQLSQDPVWRQFYEHVLGLLLGMLTSPTRTQQEVRQCRRVLSTLGAYYDRDMTRLKRQLDQVGATWKQRAGPPPQKRLGRRTLEETHRVLAAVHFLRVCGEKRPEDKVSDDLWSLTGKHLASDSIRRLVFRRKAKLGKERFRKETDDDLSWWLAFVGDGLSFSERPDGGAASKKS